MIRLSEDSHLKNPVVTLSTQSQSTKVSPLVSARALLKYLQDRENQPIQTGYFLVAAIVVTFIVKDICHTRAWFAVLRYTRSMKTVLQLYVFKKVRKPMINIKTFLNKNLLSFSKRKGKEINREEWRFDLWITVHSCHHISCRSLRKQNDNFTTIQFSIKLAVFLWCVFLKSLMTGRARSLGQLPLLDTSGRV